MADQFTPPPLSSHEGEAAPAPAAFTPPPVSSHEGSADTSVTDTVHDQSNPNTFWSSLGDKVNPLNIASGLWEFAKSTTPHLMSGAEANTNLHNEHEFLADLGDKIKNFHFGEATHKVADALVPNLSQMEQQYQNNDKGGALGTGIGTALQLYLMHRLGKAVTKSVGPSYEAMVKASANPTYADPVKDTIPVYNPTDPRYPERAPVAMSDIRQSVGPVTDNEHLASMAPDYKAGKAMSDNRAVWKQWMDRASNPSLVARPDSILSASVNSLKELADPAQKSALLSETAHKLAQEPLTAKRLEALLEEKNGELKGFYSKSDADKSAAQAAGAVSGRSQALLEAQARAIREELYNLLDPENGGAGPREIQRRYGGMKMLIDEASHGPTRNRILAETQGSSVSKGLKSGAAVASIPGKVLKGEVEEGLHKVTLPFTGTSNPLITRAFRNAPEYTPLPVPTEAEYPSIPTGRQITAGDVITPRPPDTSGSVYNERNNPMRYDDRRILESQPQPSVPSTGVTHITPAPVDKSFSEGFPAARGSVSTEPGLVHQYEIPHQKEIFVSDTDALTVPKHLREGLTLDKPREIRNSAGEKYKIVLRKDGKVYEYKQ